MRVSRILRNLSQKLGIGTQVNTGLARRILLICLVSMSAEVWAQTINTVAGGGTPGTTAKTVFFGYPAGVARDAAGNTYVAAQLGQYIFKLTATGQVSIIAGLGYEGFSGDGGPATQAAVNHPGIGPVPFDKAGNLYIGDAGNNRIRKITPSGTISTVAGTGAANMYFQGGYNGDNIPATQALLNLAYDAVVDSDGNLLIADSLNYRIRKVNSATGIITTVAGNGTAGYNGDGIPATTAELNDALDVFPDKTGGFYIADSGNNRIRHVNGATGIITTVAGNGTAGFEGDGGPAVEAELSFPNDVVQDALGNLYIIDTGNSRVREVAVKSQDISTIVGDGIAGFGGDGGPATLAEISDTSSAYLDNKKEQLLLADSGTQRIRVINANGVINTLAGGGSDGDGGPATAALLSSPVGVAVDSAGDLFIADSSPPVVRRVNPTGTITTVAGAGIEGFSGDGGPATQADFFCVSDVAVDRTGNLFISDSCNGRVRRVDHATHLVSTFAGNGTFCSAVPCGDGGPATEAALGFPAGLAVDKTGNVYIADPYNAEV